MEANLPFAEAMIPLGGVLVDLIGQIALSRLPLKIGHVRRQFIAFFAGMIAVSILFGLLRPTRALSPRDELGTFMVCALTYAFLGFVFFNTLNANLSSLRVRLLKELLAREPNGMPAAELFERYGAGEILNTRIERLAAGGQIVQRGDRYYFHPKGVALIGKFFSALRQLLLG
jgi:hypothetical protein